MLFNKVSTFKGLDLGIGCYITVIMCTSDLLYESRAKSLIQNVIKTFFGVTEEVPAVGTELHNLVSDGSWPTYLLFPCFA